MVEKNQDVRRFLRSLHHEEREHDAESFLQALQADSRNLTQEWLYDPLGENWERVSALLTKHGAILQRKCDDEVVDQVQDFLLWMVEKQKLDSHLNKGGQVKDSVLKMFFSQYLTRAWEAGGKDALIRQTTGARTQTEHRKGVTLHGEGSSNQVAYTSEEGSEDISEDYWSPEDDTPEDSLLRKQLHLAIRNRLLERHGDEEGGELFRIYKTAISGKYRSRSEWASSEGISPSVLNRRFNAARDTVVEMSA